MHNLNIGVKSVFRNRIVTCIISLFFLICLLPAYQKAVASVVPALVETQWLADNLKKPGMRIVYVGDWPPRKADFESKHIPGSVYLGVESLMNVFGDNNIAPDRAKFEALMGRLGISNNTHVVLYGAEGRNPFTSNVFWLLKYYGHKKVSYLNGGFSKWIREGRETTGKTTKVTSTSYKAVADASILADADYILQNLKNPKVAIVDTRSLGEYKGTKTRNKRAGHIPGAIHLTFHTANLKKDGTFKSVKVLKATYESKGVTKDKEVITYCLAGVRASHTYFVLKYILGYPKVRVYIGSIDDWANNQDPAKYPLER